MGSGRRESWRRALVAVLLVAAGALWLPASDLSKAVAKQHPIFLGRYTETQFWEVLLGSLLLLAVSIRVAIASRVPPGLRWKRRLLAGAAALATLLAVEVTWRVVRQPRYRVAEMTQLAGWPADLVDGVVRSRPPGRRYDVRFEDRPEVGHHFLREPPGHPLVHVRLTIDENGFRNRSVPERAEIVVLGDSFAEGSYVDDDETWPARLASRIDRGVYTMAVSGTAPADYLATARALAFRYRPRTLLCLLYEGNDFDAGALGGAVGHRGASLRSLVKSSPLRFVLKTAAMRWFGGVPVRRPLSGEESVSWIPVRVPGGSSGRPYAFQSQDLAGFFTTRELFRASPGWRAAAASLEALADLCGRHAARLAVAYAPAKPRVVLPLAADRIPAGALRSFAAFALKGLPPEPAFREQFFAHLDDREAVVEAFCRDRGIPFWSVTEALRQAASRGVQVYYTYDQHWTAEGHAAVARQLAEDLTAAGEM